MPAWKPGINTFRARNIARDDEGPFITQESLRQKDLIILQLLYLITELPNTQSKDRSGATSNRQMRDHGQRLQHPSLSN